MEKDDKGSTMIRMGVSGWKFLLVPAYPGCPGSKAVKRSLLLLLSVLPIICIALVLCMGHATGGACIDTDMLQLVAAACCDMGWISAQRGVLCSVSKKVWKHVLMQVVTLNTCCDIPDATHHNRSFSEPPTTTHNWLSSQPSTFERTQLIFSQMKKFCISQVSVVTFSGGMGIT